MKNLIKQVFGQQLKSVGSRVQKYLIRYKECDNCFFYEYDKSFKKNFLIQNMQNKSTNFLGEFCFYLLQTLKENTLVNSNSDSGFNNIPELGINRSTQGEKGSANFYGTVGTQKHYFSYKYDIFCNYGESYFYGTRNYHIPFLNESPLHHI